MKLCLAGLLIVVSAGMFCGFADAEESGSGHYLPERPHHLSTCCLTGDIHICIPKRVHLLPWVHGCVARPRTWRAGRGQRQRHGICRYFHFPLPGSVDAFGRAVWSSVAVPYVWLDVKANLLLSARRRRFAFGRQRYGQRVWRHTNSAFDVRLEGR